jgi:thiol-disulfide isomerase/thioredoxin
MFMGKRCFPVICFILAATLISTETHGVTPAQLGALNFNLYSKPSTANEMVLRDLSGTPVSLAALRGKVIILNFWKIDCIPCAAEKAILERIHRKYGPRGLAILAVNLFDNYDRMRECVGHGGYSLTFAYDPAKRFVEGCPPALSSTLTLMRSTKFRWYPPPTWSTGTDR